MERINKYWIVLLAVLMGLLFPVSTAEAKNFVVVIDAGHGGKDHGALGKRSNEKSINLAVALLLGEKIEDNCKDVDVVYTRKSDKFVSLQGRADIANKAKGDLFISIHTNSVALKNRNRTKIQGASTYTLGLHRSDDNFDVAVRENSVIEFEDDYSVKYQGFDPNSTESYIMFEFSQSKHVDQSVSFASMIQKNFENAGRLNKGVRQAGFLVLAKTSMPAVLVELDYICNPTQEKFLTSENGQRTMADAIYEAFKSYKETNDLFYATVTGGKDKKHKGNKNISKKDKVRKDEIVYKVQFVTSPKKLSSRSSYFKNLDMDKVDIYKENGTYKYTYGETNDKDEAFDLLQKVKKHHPEAFVVEFKNGKRIK